MEGPDSGRDFHHPYEPYDIQRQFMNAVYDCLENSRVGIFESPTGTGKSLSLICGSLTWLRDHKRRTFEEGFAAGTTDSDDPPWLVEHAQKQRKEEAARRLQLFNDRIAKIKAKEKRAKEHYTSGRSQSKRQKTSVHDGHGEDDEAQFALADYESDDDSRRTTKTGVFDESGMSAETQALMESLGLSIGGSKPEEMEMPDETKIFFCSRTHSQLTQFSGEINRVKLPPAITIDHELSSTGEDDLVEDERCLELQQSSSSSGRKCEYMPTKDSEVLVHDFRDNVLAKVRDIEDLGSLGKTLGICPYYASRSVTKYSEVGLISSFLNVPLR
jgi:chromosome transmission fidelity protein 1